MIISQHHLDFCHMSLWSPSTDCGRVHNAIVAGVSAVDNCRLRQ
jgi:hypothetical protein